NNNLRSSILNKNADYFSQKIDTIKSQLTELEKQKNESGDNSQTFAALGSFCLATSVGDGPAPFGEGICVGGGIIVGGYVLLSGLGTHIANHNLNLNIDILKSAQEYYQKLQDSNEQALKDFQNTNQSFGAID